MRHFRPTRPTVRYHILSYAIVAAVLLAGCGGGDESADSASAYKTRTTAFRQSELKKPAESGTVDVRACEVLSPGLIARTVGVRSRTLEAEPNNSLDLSICSWHGGRVETVKLMVDSAPRAQLRYYNLLAEQHEYYNADPARKARQIKGVGEDSAYGGAGAWWTRDRRQLVAYDHDKIIKLRVNVRGFHDRAARLAAVRLAKRSVRRLR